MYELYFDTETYRDDAVLPLLPAVEAAGNLKDPEKIKASIAERTAAQFSKLALGHHTCRLVAIGYTLPNGAVDVMTCRDAKEEALALAAFWELWQKAERRYCYNALFDMPVLVTRSLILNVEPVQVDIRKYAVMDVIDPMQRLAYNGAVDYEKLSFWCHRFALDVPKDDSTGKDIAGLVDAGNWEAVAAHCSADVLKLKALCEYLRSLKAL